MSDSTSGGGFGSSLLSALTNPGVDALMGMAQGFAQAAMPTRMPTPWGAALGMGGAGALQGVRSGQQLQQASQAIQSGEMKNQLIRSELPLELAKNKMLANVWQNPSEMQSLMGGSAGAPAAPSAPPSTTTSVDQSAATKAALSSLDPDARQMAVKAAMQANLPPGAWAPWIATVKNESGWDLKAPDHENANGSFDIGPGQVNSRTAGDLGYTVDQLRDPSTNLLASAKYFGQQWKGQNGNPALAIGHYNAGPSGTPDGTYVGRGMTTLSGWGYNGAPATGQGAVSGDTAMGTANWYEQQANQLEQRQQVAKFWQSQGLPVMPPPGDPQALRQAAQQWRQYALAGPTARAQEVAKAQTGLQMDRFGNMYQMGQDGQWHYMGRGSEVKEVAQNGHVVYGDVGGSGLGAQAPATGTPEAPPQEAPFALEHQIEERNKVLGGAGVIPGVGGIGTPATPPAATAPGAPTSQAAAPATSVPSGVSVRPIDQQLMSDYQRRVAAGQTPTQAAALAGSGVPVSAPSALPPPSPGASAPSVQDIAAIRQSPTPEGVRGFIAKYGANAYLKAVGATPGQPTTEPPAATPPPAVQQDSQHLAPGVTAHALPGGAIAITDTRKEQGEQYQSDMKDLEGATDEATAIQGNMSRLYEMRQLVNQLPQMGAGGHFRQDLSNVVATYIKPIPGLGNAASDFIQKAGDLPDASASQQFAKLALQAAGSQEKSTVGARGSLGLTRLFLQANPNIDMQQDAAKEVTNFLLVQHQMELDYLRGLHDHVVDAGQNYLQGKTDYVPAATFDKQWISQDNEKTYVAAAAALSGKPFADWSKLLGSPADVRATLGIVQRVDPSATIMWSDGKPHEFQQQAPR